MGAYTAARLALIYGPARWATLQDGGTKGGRSTSACRATKAAAQSSRAPSSRAPPREAARSNAADLFLNMGDAIQRHDWNQHAAELLTKLPNRADRANARNGTCSGLRRSANRSSLALSCGRDRDVSPCEASGLPRSEQVRRVAAKKACKGELCRSAQPASCGASVGYALIEAGNIWSASLQLWSFWQFTLRDGGMHVFGS